ncbi:Dipeptidyl-peptidase 6 [Aquimixticola soesokkakensis]|uniref:Dipeptidyl-peptidase 6 n=1 Tax=Aquimixticola soesokkakensis TaxID=1519096 RepID=A0A1Y5RIX5_9RHOB|nr:NlpC/P60 family protein [Aquimixticola soesokkakensis]SLN15926.1 Dipeptidyl-peptidase 6 [Aquimixticola soesokkakensis]
MTDRRSTPANARVALTGFASADQREVTPERVSISRPVADLRRDSGQRDRQLLMGEAFDVLERHAGRAFGISARDAYVGYIEEGDLGLPVVPTHTIGVRASHLYPEPDLKSEALLSVSFGTRLVIVDERHKFMETDTGLFVPKSHLRLVAKPFSDPVTIAQLFFGTPYLWGGNSAFGIDCSGLVQAGLLACGEGCPGDSDLQESLGGAATGAMERGDLMFWKGHVAWVVDAGTILHANAHHMAVAYEPMDKAIARIEAQGGGPVTARRRL